MLKPDILDYKNIGRDHSGIVKNIPVGIHCMERY